MIKTPKTTKEHIDWILSIIAELFELRNDILATDSSTKEEELHRVYFSIFNVGRTIMPFMDQVKKEFPKRMEKIIALEAILLDMEKGFMIEKQTSD